MRFWILSFLNAALSQTITRIPTTDTPPEERQYHVLDFYQKGNCLITFGGNQGVSKIYNDVWQFSFEDYRWHELQAASQITPCKR
ncbi:unnamed protein product [Blepharisma stoltei]|uniref:Galactose oxidase n=1 Tax=Blepharisma stoltei TaxID=1481888 RepID=A0AAU9IAL3_9CILI|nr:unnamed protein product [Blepharisma stoltei]